MKFRQSVRTRGHKHDATSQASQMPDQVQNRLQTHARQMVRQSSGNESFGVP
jgi:hypothetical protein